MASGADRISALPDEILHHVMSFLPMHEVVPTSLLARRWLDLWKSAPSLHVTGVKDCDNASWFIQYVDNLLLLRHAGACLDSFYLDLNECDFGFEPFLPTYEGHVNMWFRIALLSQARHLKILDLQRVTLKKSTLDFSGCPTLVDLKMKECQIQGNVSSPFLKHLSITSCDFVTSSLRARIYMPGLILLVLSRFTCRTPLLESMPLLVSAIVRVKDCEDECSKSSYGDCGDHTCLGCYDFDHGANDRRGESLLLKGLSQVTELELSVDSTVFIVNRDLKLCPMFCKLKTLFLSAWCPGVAADLNVLTCFLQHSPILEKLVLQLPKVSKDRVGTERSYKQSDQLFICSHLKIVDIKCDEVDWRVQKTLEILSTYGVPLEQVNIQQTGMSSGP
ncbi:unnamed protein product [Urochloa decumbens]|uniref:F-box domain-containing protein n=1 Tax=Urochloa decumbens TaxID=240449 RepID=A0ABC8WGT7_9POAL